MHKNQYQDTHAIEPASKMTQMMVFMMAIKNCGTSAIVRMERTPVPNKILRLAGNACIMLQLLLWYK